MDKMKRAESLLTDYGDSILRLAYSYLHNLQDAEDILQETLIRYIKAAPPFESAGHEKAWLMRVAVNLSKNKIKHNRIRCHDELKEELVSADRDDLGHVWDAVRELPEIYREVIHLFYQEGYSTRQIADLLSLPESTVRVRLNRGRKRLKKILKEEYDFGE